MIHNYKCDVCEKAEICKNKSKLDKFSEDAKTDLGIEITFNHCDFFGYGSNDSDTPSYVAYDENDENDE